MAGSFLFPVVLVVVLSLSSASTTNDQRRNKEEVVDFSMDIIEGGIGYTEKIEVDLEKQTELFQVPTHPGVDRSDVLHDFKSNLTMLRFPESKVCYLFPLVKRQSTPEKLMKDLKTAQEMVVTETRRLYSTWVLNEEVTDRSSLGEELNEYCAQYTIYHVTEKREQVTAEQTGGTLLTNRVRRQSGSGLNGTKLCRGGMDLNRALQVCSEPRMKCENTSMCFQIKKCREAKRRVRRSWMPFFLFGHHGGSHGLFGRHSLRYVPPIRRTQQKKVKRPRCWYEHDTRSVIECCKYVCDKVDRPTTPISPTTETMENEDRPTTPISQTPETMENEDRPTTPISPTTETMENEDRPTTPISQTTETMENEDRPTTPTSQTTETMENEDRPTTPISQTTETEGNEGSIVLDARL